MKKSISIAATFTVDSISDSLKLLLQQLNLQYQVEFAAYGQLFQQFLEPASLFNANKTGVNIALVRLDDLLKSNNTKNHNDENTVSRLARDFSAALTDYSVNSKTPLLVLMMPSNDETVLATAADFFNIISKAVSSSTNVYVKNYAEINGIYPVDNLFDAESEDFGHVPYTENLFAALSCYLCRFATAFDRPEKKVIVLDCDNTLWQGVCGEDGVAGITITEGHKYLQKFMLDQASKGMLLCLNSKNSEDDVIQVFRHNKEMQLSLNDLVLLRVNWQVKSQNLKSLASELNLGLDSFVFLDDNPVEIAEVNASCPQVLTLQVPDNWQEIPAMLDQAWVFDKFRVTDADKNRTASYQDNVKRQSLQTSTSSFTEFLRKLQLEIQIEPLTQVHLARAVQLNLRTNQFNASTKRRDDAALTQLSKGEDNTAVYTVQVSDRFGEYGIVGLMSTRIVTGQKIIITDFVLSCRALGKGVEHKMLSFVAQQAIAKDLLQVIVEFTPNERNEPVFQFLESLKQTKASSPNVADYHYQSVAINNLVFKGASLSTPLQQAEPSNNMVQLNVAPNLNEITFHASVMKYCQPIQLLDTLAIQSRPRPEIQQSFVIPQPGLESQLASIWQRVLGIQDVGSQDRFTDLGGRSLQLVKVHALILGELGFNVSIVTLFEYTTVSALALYLGSANDSQEIEKSNNKSMVNIKQRALKQRAMFRKMKK